MVLLPPRSLPRPLLLPRQPAKLRLLWSERRRLLRRPNTPPPNHLRRSRKWPRLPKSRRPRWWRPHQPRWKGFPPCRQPQDPRPRLPRAAHQVMRTQPLPLLPHRRAAWSCPRPDRARFTRRPPWHPRPAPELHPAPSNGASPSLTADPPPDPLASDSVPPALVRMSRAAVPVPSIPLAPPRAPTRARVRPVRAPASASARASARHGPASAGRAPVQASRRRPRLRVPSVLLKVAGAAAPNSTPRPRKVR